MATRSAKLYQGEDMTPVIDYTDQVIWEESEFGARAWQGEGSASTVVIRDPLGEQGNSANLPSGLTSRSLASKNLFVVDLDGDILFRGRVGIKNYSRDDQLTERYRQVEVSLHDTHWDLDHIFVHGYPRPSETGNARIQGLIASYLSGSPRPTTDLNGSNFLSSSNTVTLAAQTFNRTTPLQIIKDTALAENKQFFITGDTVGGGSMFYDGNDSTVYPSGVRISDRAEEIDTSGTCSADSTVYSDDFESYAIDPTPHVGIQTSDFDVSDGGTKFLCISSSSGTTGFPSDDGPWGEPGNANIPVTPGGVYTVTARVAKRDEGLSAVDKVSIEWRNDSGGFPSPGTVGTPTVLKAGGWANATWYDLSATVTAPSNAHFMTLYFSAILDGWYLGSMTVEGEASNTLTFPPIWNVGPASTEDGSEQLCEVILFYGPDTDQYVTVHNLTVHTQYGHASETFTDDTIVSAAEATRRANSILAHRQYEDKTYNVTIGPLRDDQVTCVRHGQTINIKARAIPDADDQFRLMRIVQCRYTTPVVGLWFAHLQLGRPWKLEPYGNGISPAPASSAVATIVDYDNATSGLTATNVQDAIDELATDTVVDHGSMGATETFDASAGSDHEGTQDANLTVTLTGATAGTAAWMTLVLTQDATGGRTLTLPASVANGSDVETAWDTTANAVNVLSLFTYDGGTTWYGFLAGGSGGAAASSTHWEPVIFDNAGTPEPVYFEDANGVWDIVMHEVAN